MDGVVPIGANVVAFDAEFTHLRIADGDLPVGSGVSGGRHTKPCRGGCATQQMKHGVERAKWDTGPIPAYVTE